MQKTLIFFIIVFFSLTLTAIAAEKTIQFSWDKSPEVDVQSYRLYFDVDVEKVKAKTSSYVDTHGPASPETLSDKLNYTHNRTTPDGEDVTTYYAVTAIDTSGNESEVGETVAVQSDFLSPAPVTGLTAVIQSISE